MLKKIFAAAICGVVIAALSGHADAAGPGSLARSFAAASAYRVVDSAAATHALPDKNGCLLFSGSCMTSAIRAEALLDDARREELRKVNAAVNEQMGTLDDYFTSFDKKASVPMFMIEQDCSDCAAIKRRELIGLGWPPRGLRVGYALTGNGDLQKVLIIETDGGSVVLGNAAHRASGKTASMAL